MDWLWHYLKLVRVTEMSLSDIFDILIISYVIYQLFLLMKGTRAAKMATGIAFLDCSTLWPRWPTCAPSSGS